MPPGFPPLPDFRPAAVEQAVLCFRPPSGGIQRIGVGERGCCPGLQRAKNGCADDQRLPGEEAAACSPGRLPAADARAVAMAPAVMSAATAKVQRKPKATASDSRAPAAACCPDAAAKTAPMTEVPVSSPRLQESQHSRQTAALICGGVVHHRCVVSRLENGIACGEYQMRGIA